MRSYALNSVHVQKALSEAIGHPLLNTVETLQRIGLNDSYGGIPLHTMYQNYL